MSDAEVNRKLSERGVAAHLRSEGRAGLIQRWRSFIEELESGYRGGLDDYRNDLDLREIIEYVGLGKDDEVVALDDLFRAQIQDQSHRTWKSEYPDAFWVRGYPQKISDHFWAEVRSSSGGREE